MIISKSPKSLGREVRQMNDDCLNSILAGILLMPSAKLDAISQELHGALKGPRVGADKRLREWAEKRRDTSSRMIEAREKIKEAQS